MVTKIKSLGQYIANKMGYEVHPINNPKRGWYEKYLRSLCTPETVIDIGVGCGTNKLYSSFPEARIHLVEPLSEYDDDIEKICNMYNAKHHKVALGEEEGSKKINIDTGNLHKSSLRTRSELTKTKNKIEKREIKVKKLDDIFKSKNNIKRPSIVKIDTEGHELNVIKGGKSVLAYTDVLIVEVSVAKRFKKTKKFDDIIVALNKLGFVFWDILALNYIKGRPGVRLMDVVFKRK